MKYKCYFAFTVVLTLCGELSLFIQITQGVCHEGRNFGSALLMHLLLVNLITAFTFLLDKCLAVNNGCRIPELVLCIMTFFGAPIGALFGMHCCCHKTKKKSFKDKIFCLCFINMAWFSVLVTIIGVDGQIFCYQLQNILKYFESLMMKLYENQ